MPLDTMPGGSSGGKKKKRGGSPPPPPPPPPQPTNPTGPPVHTYNPPPATQTTRNSAQERAEKRRERAEQRQERNEKYRDRYSQIRNTRLRSRLLRVEDSLLGQPEDTRTVLPVVIGEKWNRGGNQTLTTGTQTTVEFGASDYTTERAGYPLTYDDSTFIFSIPPGLEGVWSITGAVRFDGHATGHRNVRILLNNATVIYSFRVGSSGTAELSLPIACTWEFFEGDFFEVQVLQNSGGNLNLVGGQDNNQVSVIFQGTA